MLAQHEPPIYYGKNGQATFQALCASESLSVKEIALAQLQIYVESYLQGYQQMQMVPMKNIQRYLEAYEHTETPDFEMIRTLLHHLAEGIMLRMGIFIGNEYLHNKYSMRRCSTR